MIAQFNSALNDAMVGLTGIPATPEVCEQIKNVVILIMLRKYGVDMTAFADEIRIEFMENGRPNLLVPLELMHRSLH